MKKKGDISFGSELREAMILAILLSMADAQGNVTIKSRWLKERLIASKVLKPDLVEKYNYNIIILNRSLRALEEKKIITWVVDQPGSSKARKKPNNFYHYRISGRPAIEILKKLPVFPEPLERLLDKAASIA